MTIDHPAASGPPAPAPAAAAGAGAGAARAKAPPSWPWRRAALLLAVAAQLIMIAALVSADPIAVTWSSLLLAVAPAPLAFAALYGPGQADRLVAVAGVAALVAGIADQAAHGASGRAGWAFVFFVPALILLAIGGAMRWREPS